MNDSISSLILEQDYEGIKNNIEEFLKNKVQQCGSKGVIFGLSGGIDSTTLAYLCANVFEKNATALIMPDSKISPKEETEDAIKTVDKLGIDYRLIDINPIHKSYANYLEPDEKSLGNLRARIRANLIYYNANLHNKLVVGASDKSEYLIGYFTKFGDGSADLLPMKSLFKTQIRKLAEYLGVSKNIIEKKSSPNLWKGHLAESEIGLEYEEIDSILYCLVDKEMSVKETVQKTEISIDAVEKIQKMFENSKHKRILPEGV